MSDINAVRMLAVCRTLTVPVQQTFSDLMTIAPAGPDWSHPSWNLDSQASDGLPTTASPDQWTAPISGTGLRTALLADKGIATSGVRSVTLTHLPGFELSFGHASSIHILMDMHNTSPLQQGSVRLAASRDVQGSRTLQLIVNEGTAVATATPGIAPGSYRNITLSIDQLGIARAFWKDDAVPDLTFDLSTLGYMPAGGRVGFGLNASTAVVYVDSFTFKYFASTTSHPPEMLMASAAGKLFRETTGSTMVEVVDAPQLTLRDDRLIGAANRLDKLYIADYQLRKAGTATGVVSGAGTTFTDAGVNFASLDVDSDDDMLEIISATGSIPGFYKIATVVTTTITLATSATNGTAITYRITRGPKIYDANTDNMTLVGSGTVGVSQFPAGFRSISLWDDRLVLSNHADTPGLWVMSAKGYPGLWYFGDTDGTLGADGTTTPPLLTLGVGNAVSGGLAEFGGLLPEPIVTTIPINDDLLVFGCKGGFYVLRGNPRLGGARIDNISREVGILDIGAWCRSPDGRLFAMTLDGLYEIKLEGVIPLSRDMLPQELVALNPDRYEVSIGYDFDHRGVLIAAVPRDSDNDPDLPSVHYFYDLRAEGFFPGSHLLDNDATAMVNHQIGGVGKRRLILGGRDGYLRNFDDATADDDGMAFESNVFYGPLRLGSGEYGDGYLHEIICVLDVESGSVTLKVRVGHSAQAAKSATPRYETMMSAGRNRNRYPRLRGGAAYIEIVGSPGAKWAMESLTVTRQAVGRLVVA